jgi:hypothetical protein
LFFCIGFFGIYGNEAWTLFGSRNTHSFILRSFVEKLEKSTQKLGYELQVHTSTSVIMISRDVLKDVPIQI